MSLTFQLLKAPKVKITDALILYFLFASPYLNSSSAAQMLLLKKKKKRGMKIKHHGFGISGLLHCWNQEFSFHISRFSVYTHFFLFFIFFASLEKN